MPETDQPAGRPRPFGSRLLSAVDRWASQPLTGLIVLAAAIGWILVSIVAGFPQTLGRHL